MVLTHLEQRTSLSIMTFIITAVGVPLNMAAGQMSFYARVSMMGAVDGRSAQPRNVFVRVLPTERNYK